jgi:MSHA biogenesis protein MshQ
MLRVNNLSGFGRIIPAVGGGGGGTVTWHSMSGHVFSTAGGTTVSPAYPASIAAGDMLVVIVGQKPQSVTTGGTADTPSGWAALTAATGATGGYETDTTADAGNTNLFAFYLEAAGGESGTLDVTLGTNNVAWAVMHRLSKDTGTWDLANVNGGDTSGDATWSVAFGSDPGVRANDFILVAACIPTDINAGGAFSSPSLSQSGVTFGTVDEEAEPFTNTGLDIAGGLWRCPVTAGTSSGNPTFSATVSGTATNVRGPGMLIRVRAA